jgi:hypothetical protein
MTFRVVIDDLTIVCRSTRWGDFDVVEHPAEASGFVEWLRATYGWGYAEETPYHLLWDSIVPEDKRGLVPHIIHGIAVVNHGADKLWELIKDFQLSELDLNALYLAATRNSKDTRRVRAWLAGIEFPNRKELVASLLTTPQYVGVALTRASSYEVPTTARVSREVADAILRNLQNAFWSALEWMQLLANSGYEDLIDQYKTDARVRPFIEEFYAHDASRAWDIFNNSKNPDARARALTTLVRSGHSNAVDAVRTALEDTSTVVREAAFDHLDILPREEYARWLVHFAYHGIPGDYGETRKLAWYKIQKIVPEEKLAEFLTQKLR